MKLQPCRNKKQTRGQPAPHTHTHARTHGRTHNKTSLYALFTSHHFHRYASFKSLFVRLVKTSDVHVTPSRTTLKNRTNKTIMLLLFYVSEARYGPKHLSRPKDDLHDKQVQGDFWTKPAMPRTRAMLQTEE